MWVMLVRWTCRRSPILPTGSEPVRLKTSTISVS